MATVTTIEPTHFNNPGFHYSGFLSEMNEVIGDLKNKYKMEEINYPETYQRV